MFTFTSKRQRDPEQDDFDGNATREKKKHRPLPLRASPTTLQFPSFQKSNRVVSRFGLSTPTPVESSDDDKDDNGVGESLYNCSTQPWCLPMPTTARLQQCPPTSATQQDPQHLPHTLSANMDIDNGKETHGLKTASITHCLVGHSHIISERPVAHSANDAVRAAQDSVAKGYHQSSTSSTQRGVLRDPYSIHDRVWWCGQRLPSPVSDDEDAMAISSKDSASDADMTYLSQPASPPPWDPGATADLQPPTGLADNLVLGCSPTSVLKKKVTFSMGYRADCEKCRHKVPGHYSHIMRC
ncbi:hypothetical protein BO94DRAFT_626797 [Aspergillus sclerotioniger CBS 115572]|uniref:Uncharacterized protein n=1 Tax=Aspergillus sclerotioniger CBS 115572 TaxID=1450535 RepID=A0A317VWA5_9EURO|nr:hypothetical protein BO94DRAFT_626797 [Aspergillus sclerotioniger CBS 115572]PWY77188.1 hypothetical protein BO94DRAFT_626797 [Aspergillus sclerotioniger CBS 115572]